ncbi:MAG: PTS galactosamine transporter subunit IIB [Erysipelotrichaceae bacterium]
MDTPNILLGRIDNRLVHGQVGVTWTNFLSANLIIVADDVVAEEEVQQELMELTAITSGADIRFFTVQKTIDVIWNASPDQKIFIVTRTPKQMRQLIEGNVPIKDINVGNMHFEEGKKQISLKVFVDDNDLDDLHYMQKQGLHVYIQEIPGKLEETIK